MIEIVSNITGDTSWTESEGRIYVKELVIGSHRTQISDNHSFRPTEGGLSVEKLYVSAAKVPNLRIRLLCSTDGMFTMTERFANISCKSEVVPAQSYRMILRHIRDGCVVIDLVPLSKEIKSLDVEKQQLVHFFDGCLSGDLTLMLGRFGEYVPGLCVNDLMTSRCKRLALEVYVKYVDGLDRSKVQHFLMFVREGMLTKTQIVDTDGEFVEKVFLPILQSISRAFAFKLDEILLRALLATLECEYAASPVMHLAPAEPYGVDGN